MQRVIDLEIRVHYKLLKPKYQNHYTLVQVFQITRAKQCKQKSREIKVVFVTFYLKRGAKQPSPRKKICINWLKLYLCLK